MVQHAAVADDISVLLCRAPLRLDFNNIPELPEFVKGTRKQICLAKTASKTASKQKPQEQQYQVGLHVEAYDKKRDELLDAA